MKEKHNIQPSNLKQLPLETYMIPPVYSSNDDVSFNKITDISNNDISSYNSLLNNFRNFQSLTSAQKKVFLKPNIHDI